jgi:NADPH-dependent glutamate synthase beta subunit-like oxidoreductase
VDDPIAINDLKRFVVDWADTQDEYPHEQRCEADSGFSVAIVGAGPAGLSAAHDLRLRGHAVTVIDDAETAGGVLARLIPKYRLPEEAIARDVERVFELGVKFIGGTRIGRDMSFDELRGSGHDAIYLAIGAHRPRMLDLGPAEEGGRPVMRVALPFLESARRGERSASLGRVAVIGGGNAAVDAARTALRMGACEVTMACLEAREAMPALREELEDAHEEGVVVVPSVRPVRFVTGGLEVAGLSDGVESILPCDTVILAIGQQPNTDFLTGSGVELALDGDGCLIVDRDTCQTSEPGIYAGGDVVAGERTVTAAMASGLRAAWAIDRELRGEEAANRRVPPRHPVQGGGERPHWEGSAMLSNRQPVPCSSADARREFVEVRGSYTEADARAEARRCLACGLCGNCRACTELFACPALADEGEHVSIDPGLCIDCGACADLCSNGAIGLGLAAGREK